MLALRLRAAQTILVVALATITAVAPPVALVVATAAAFVVAPSDAEARSGSSRSSSSGGYSRSGSSSSSSSRTPSIGGYRSGSSSSSGGYSRPTGKPAPSAGSPAPSASDRAISRQNSARALERYRTPPVATAPADRTPSPSYGSSPGAPGTWSRPSVEDYEVNQRRRQNGAPPPYAYRTQRSFGAWDAAFLWLMLNSLSTPSHAQFFSAHRDDPGVQAWRQEADRVAQSDPAVRAQLQTLDSELASTPGAATDPSYIPDDVNPADARAAPASNGHGVLWTVLIVLLFAFILLWLRRRGAAQRRLSGDSAMSLAANMLHDKLSGKEYKPSLFRVGMVVTLDPTPFILAASSTKVALPASLSGGGAVSVERIGVATDGQTMLHRLYLPGEGGGMIQFHLDAAGRPDECRYFTPLDEINPADKEEWGLWLDPGEGMIGWPAFETRDGMTYGRVWAPGQSWIEPRSFTEQLEDLQGKSTRRQTAMLYARQTGAAAPSPTTEYVLVMAVEQLDQAWVEVHVGIDINPTALSLA